METPAGIRIIDYQNIAVGKRRYDIECDGPLVELGIVIQAIHRDRALVKPVIEAMPRLTISLGARPLSQVLREHIANGLRGGNPAQPTDKMWAWMLERNYAFQSARMRITGIYQKTKNDHLIFVDTKYAASRGCMGRIWDHEVNHLLDYIDPNTKKADTKDQATAVGILVGTYLSYYLGSFALLSLLKRCGRNQPGQFLSSVSERVSASMLLASIVTIPSANKLYHQFDRTEISAEQNAVEFPTPQEYFDQMFSFRRKL